MNTTNQTPAHADQAREHLTQKIREDANRYWPTTPSWELADHFQQAVRTDAAAAAGHALLAIREELATLRGELAEDRVETAQRRGQAWQHTHSIASSTHSIANSLAGIGPAVALALAEQAELRHKVTALDKGLTGIADAVRELAAAVNESRPRPRRWSLRRRRDAFNDAHARVISEG